VLVLRVTAPLYTANVRASSDAITERCRQRRPGVVVIDARALGRLSVTVLDAVKELDRELMAEGTQLWVAELPAAALVTVQRTHWWAQWQHEGRVHTSVTAAVDAASRRKGQAPH
jgi:MFS superfamily sulfate permease-like transporter